MTYETAKKLKEAKFPKEDWKECGHCLYADGTQNPLTLEELIDSFGDDFNFVCRNSVTGKWSAETYKTGIVVSNADSHVEAVALLWLKLNVK